MNERYFLTVDWCNKGQRGVFCGKDGTGFFKEGKPHTEQEMMDILDTFYIILNPKSEKFSEEEIKQYNRWRPLAEYKNQYGIALKGHQ